LLNASSKKWFTFLFIFLVCLTLRNVPNVYRIYGSDRACSDCRSALLIAIDNENVEMIELLLSVLGGSVKLYRDYIESAELLLSAAVELGDALLHAIDEENVEAVELLLRAHQQQSQSGRKDLQASDCSDVNKARPLKAKAKAKAKD